jgi:NADH dehydrogenase
VLSAKSLPSVVIIGAGFGGLWAIESLDNAPVEVLLIDQNNYHTFYPLLYQVGAAELAPEQIASPVRSILHRRKNTQFLMEKVERIDLESKTVHCIDGRAVPYDFLVLSTGSVSSFFGIPGAEENALPLRSLEEGIGVRNHILW